MPTPGTNGIIELTTQLLATDVPRDFTVNRFSVNTTSTAVTSVQWQALSDAIKGVWFATSGTFQYYGTNGGSVKCYDRADAKPRPEKAFSNYTPGSWMSTVSWPRQTACCVSFYAGRNLKRFRGRMFFPLNSAFTPVGERISSGLRTQVTGTIKQLATVIGALTPVWKISVHSNVDDMDYVIDHVWCNDVWDTIRSRSPKESARTTSTVP